MSLAHDHATWPTGHLGDTVKVYATAEPDGDGGVAYRWHWRRTHSSGRVLARSAEPKKRRRDALWEARRVNPPLTAAPPRPDSDVCTCGHDVTDHGNGPVGCIHRDGCGEFHAAPTGPEPGTDAAVGR